MPKILFIPNKVLLSLSLLCITRSIFSFRTRSHPISYQFAHFTRTYVARTRSRDHIRTTRLQLIILAPIQMSSVDDPRGKNKQYFCDCPEHCKLMKQVSQTTYYRHSKYREPAYRDWHANRRDAIEGGIHSCGPQRTERMTALSNLTTSTSVTVCNSFDLLSSV